ncbi:hypothetical protein K438DRAFT_2071094 [Mycena galopus ATCC 62051]|nr:hypothetical protein K438DRAFT_2071094 [Mycena galopus ATCC 62051]
MTGVSPVFYSSSLFGTVIHRLLHSQSTVAANFFQEIFGGAGELTADAKSEEFKAGKNRVGCLRDNYERASVNVFCSRLLHGFPTRRGQFRLQPTGRSPLPSLSFYPSRPGPPGRTSFLTAVFCDLGAPTRPSIFGIPLPRLRLFDLDFKLQVPGAVSGSAPPSPTGDASAILPAPSFILLLSAATNPETIAPPDSRHALLRAVRYAPFKFRDYIHLHVGSRGIILGANTDRHSHSAPHPVAPAICGTPRLLGYASKEEHANEEYTRKIPKIPTGGAAEAVPAAGGGVLRNTDSDAASSRAGPNIRIRFRMSLFGVVGTRFGATLGGYSKYIYVSGLRWAT